MQSIRHSIRSFVLTSAIDRSFSYLLPKDETFSNEILHQFVAPDIAVECMTRKLGILLNVD